MLKQTIRIKSYDVCSNGTVKLSSLMKYMQQIAREDIDQYGATYDKMREHDMVFVIIKLGIVFDGVIKCNDEIEVLTINNAITGVTFVREFVISKNGVPVARATTDWVLMSYSRRMPMRPSAMTEIFDIPQMKMDIEGVDLPRKIEFEGEYDKSEEHKVRFSELDENSHMNNTVYADLIYDYAPCDVNGFIKECRICFNGEARLNDVLSVNGVNTKNGCIIKCKNMSLNRACFEASISFRYIYGKDKENHSDKQKSISRLFCT